MTRSNDPFEDLPEWKERRRLQEIQAMREAAERATAGRAEERGEPFAAAPGGFPATAPADAGYEAAGHWSAGDTQPAFDHGHAPQHTPAYADYDQYGYQSAYAGAAPQPSHAAPTRHDAWAAESGFSQAQAPEPAFRGGQYDDPRFAYAQPHAQAQPQPQSYTPSLDDYRTPSPHAVEPAFGAPQSYPGEAQLDDGHYRDARYEQGVEGDEYDDEYEYEYDAEEDEGGSRYGWKLMAAMVVAGVLVVGGGVFLYDMLAGGDDSSGPAPVIKADRGPSKTAPEEPGGKSFANQDSKLLGRLDNGKPSTRRVELDSDTRGRVREVPTVRVSPDGRLILPKEPQGVVGNTATATQDGGSAPAAPSVPGINIVDSLSGGRSGIGSVGLPPVVPQAPETAERSAPAPAAADTTARQVTSSPSAPIIRNRASASQGANLATARADTPPPVPQKSALSSAWRMTRPASTSAPQAAPPARETVTQSAVPPTTTASTLGAASVASGGTRQYIAVVATKSTRMEALESFAELQQRHPQALSNRVPTVQQADLSSRGLGTMYRLLVGPAGSRQAANTVCANLKASGYNGCWVKAH